jgi:hypothetical protein
VPNDLTLDHSKYLCELDGMDISEDSKRELLEVLWDIMRMFVELGYDADVRGQVLNQIFNKAALGDAEVREPQ